METLRPLLYPLGLLPLIPFALRFWVQWIYSERVGRSAVPRLFWQLSLLGNILLCLHYFIQVQYPFSFVQAVSAVISWRNLDLMNPQPKYSTRTAVAAAAGIAMLLTASFMIQGWLTVGHLDWVRTPAKLWDAQPSPKFALPWHILGGIGAGLFASRFWLQWWEAEQHQRSTLSRSFWWISIIGSVLSLTYFVRLGDVVGICNYAFGLIPAVRNLMLLARSR